MDFSIIGYDLNNAWMQQSPDLEELLQYRNPAGITWINIDKLEDTEALHLLAETFHIHPLTMEDIMDTEQRPKIEEFDDYLYIVFKAVNPASYLDFEQISIVLTRDTVITFQEKAGDYFDGIRKRILNNGGRIRRMGTDYLAYVLMDAAVDRYFTVLDEMSSDLEEFEVRAIDQSDKVFIQDIQKVKQDILRVRRAIWPLREGLSFLVRLESKLISAELLPFLKDLYDHIINVTETVEISREIIAGAMEVNLSAVSNRMNNVMKLLTVISTIFIPLTFIVGVYGMNFDHMPELQYKFAYPITWGVMALIALGMIIFFKRKRWL